MCQGSKSQYRASVPKTWLGSRGWANLHDDGILSMCAGLGCRSRVERNDDAAGRSATER